MVLVVQPEPRITDCVSPGIPKESMSKDNSVVPGLPSASMPVHPTCGLINASDWSVGQGCWPKARAQAKLKPQPSNPKRRWQERRWRQGCKATAGPAGGSGAGTKGTRLHAGSAGGSQSDAGTKCALAPAAASGQHLPNDQQMGWNAASPRLLVGTDSRRLTMGFQCT